MLSRSVASAILIGVSLFSVRAYVTGEQDTPPHPTAIDAHSPKTVLPTRAVVNQSIPDLPISLGRTGAPLSADASTADYRRFGETGRTVTDTLPTDADLVIRVSELGLVVPGGTTVYTLTIRNQGPAPATGIVLTNVLPKGLIPVWTLPAQPWCDRQERSVRCALGDMGPGDTTAITLDLSIGGDQTHQTNTQLAGVTLNLSMPNCTIDASQFSVTCRLTKLPPGADVPIRLAARLDAQTTGPLINSATVTANETDPNPANNRTAFTMTLGAAAPTTVAPVPTTADLVMQAEGPSSVIAGQPFTYTYTITNQGDLDATGVHFEDALPPTANLYAYSPGLPACEQRGDILSCSLRDPDSGETIPFTLLITGTAGQPVRVTPDQPMPGWPICTVLKERTWLHIVKCELGTLKRGQTTHVQLGLVAIGLMEGMMTNTAFVRARESDLNSQDNTTTATMAVRVRADLSVRSALSGSAVAGRPLSYTLTVANNGPSDADGVVLTDTLPMSTQFVSAVPSQGDDCRLEQKDDTPGAVVCRLGPLNGGRTAFVTIVVAVDESSTPAVRILHSAKVVSEQPDPDPRNNELIESIPVSIGAKE